MGWTSYHRPQGESDREHFQRELFTNSDREIVECATVNGVFYAAIRVKATTEVWALIILMQRMRGDHNFAYKDMVETAGPVMADAPSKVLDALTPTDNEYALEWRLRCRINLAKRADAHKRKKAVTAGVVIQTAVPLHFANDLKATLFECAHRSGRTFRWVAVTDDGTRFSCRLGATWAESCQWEIVPAQLSGSPATS